MPRAVRVCAHVLGRPIFCAACLSVVRVRQSAGPPGFSAIAESLRACALGHLERGSHT